MQPKNLINLERRMDKMEQKIDVLTNNHLKHMQHSLDSIHGALKLGSALLTVGLLVVLAVFWSL